jgi:hypothetical protein
MYTSIHIYMYVHVYVHVSYGMCIDTYMDSDMHMYTWVHGLCIFEDPHMNLREEGSRSLLGTEQKKGRTEGTTFHTKSMVSAL